jgi:RsiW-degrading membrane proteinase PrsW (M82 family)
MTLTPALHMVVTVLAAIPITALTAMVWLLVLRRFIPFYHDKNLTSALRTFFSAGFVSVPIILVFNVTIAPIGYARTFSAVTELWNMVVIVGILEEFSKWIVFAVLMQRLRPLRSPEDGILLAAAVGLAFASVENVLYASTYGLRILWFRSVFNTVGHMTYAALWGFVWSAVTWESGGRISHREVPVAGAAVIAVAILHGLYNSSLYLGVAIGLGVKFIILLLSIAAYQHLVDHSPYRTYPRRSARRAIVELRTALRHNPRSVILRRRLGMHQLRLRDYAAAGAELPSGTSAGRRNVGCSRLSDRTRVVRAAPYRGGNAASPGDVRRSPRSRSARPASPAPGDPRQRHRAQRDRSGRHGGSPPLGTGVPACGGKAAGSDSTDPSKAPRRLGPPRVGVEGVRLVTDSPQRSARSQTATG